MAIVCGGTKIGREFVLAGAFLAGILLAGGLNVQLCAQNLPVPNANVVEQQDYAFADGLYRDGLFEMALEQFNKEHSFTQWPETKIAYPADHRIQ